MALTDSTLAKYGFAWETKPYRIVDIKTKKDVYVGMSFDLRPVALSALRKGFDNKQASMFKVG